MSLRELFHCLMFGPTPVRQQCILGLRDPQSEVSVWLCGSGAPFDVTDNHVMACAQPLIVAIGIPNQHCLPKIGSAFSLQFRAANQRLAEIALQMVEAIAIGREYLCLFRVRSCRNYCLPRQQLWAHYTRAAYRRWRSRARSKASEGQMAARKLHCVFALYIRPRPVFLVSAAHGAVSNLFPMDLVGSLGHESFALALHSTSTGLKLLTQSRRVALCSVPYSKAPVVFVLGKQHNVSSIDHESLPFSMTRSSTFSLPVPEFSLRVREMKIQMVRPIGSHTLFVAKTVEDELWRDDLQLFQIHGFYHAWRQRLQRSPSLDTVGIPTP